MKIICHMGLPKTGTTSLQTALSASRDKLREHGVYYPDGGAARANHMLLTALYKPETRVTAGVKYLFDQNAAKMQRAATQMWGTIRKEVESKKPKLLILSSEFFYIFTNHDEFVKFHAMLSQLSNDVTPVLYVREAAALYGSVCQQCIKNGRPPEPPGNAKLSIGLPLADAAFGRDVVVCNTDRDRLIDGDILTDFLARFVTPIVGPIPIAPIRLNESVSAEVLAILDRFRRLRYPEPAGVMPEHFDLRRILAKLEPGSGRSAGPRLRPEFAQAVRRSTVDMLWLRERYGIEFAGVDYGAIDGAALPFDPTKAAVEDVFEVDLDRRDALQAAALAEALAGWRSLERMPRLSRVVSAAGGGLLSRMRRIGA